MGIDQGVEMGRQFAMGDRRAARLSASVTRASSARVSGAAVSHVGERQMPMRGVVPGLASGLPRWRPETAPANSAQSATVRAMTPIVSRLSDMIFMPMRLIRP